MYIIEDVWKIIKDFLLNYKKTHQLKYIYCLNNINGMYGEVYKRWTHLYDIPKNTNEIILNNVGSIIPVPGLTLTSIMKNGTHQGTWCGYGWEKKKCYG